MPTAPTIEKPPLYDKYHLKWKPGQPYFPPWLVELRCWSRRLATGYSPFHHLKSAYQIIWPNHIWHEWNEWSIGAFCDDSTFAQIHHGNVVRNFSWMGAAASGKTYTAIQFILLWFFADPANSIVTLVTTTKDRAKARMWSPLQTALAEFSKVYTPPQYNAVDSSMVIEHEKGQRKHAIYTLAVEAGEINKAIANIQGSHARRMFLLVDEAMGVPSALFSAVPNIFKGASEVNLLWISNAPHTRLNPFMKLACPINGWQSVTPEDKLWRTKAVPAWQIPEGWCFHFSGKDSPNVKAQREVCPGLYSYSDWVRVENNPEIAKTPAFWSQDLGFPPPEGALFTILTESLIETKDATGQHEFISAPTAVAGFDPSWGNDQCLLTFGLLGDIGSNLQGIQITEYLNIPIDVQARDLDGKKIPPDYQIGARVKSECQARGVQAESLGVLSTGNPGVVAWLQVNFGEIFTIQEGGAASELPASISDTRPANQVYDRRVTELYFLLRSFVEGGQLKGLYEEAVNQLCSRLYDEEKSTRRSSIEKKDKFKPRYGRSPDNAESIIAICAVARNLGCEPMGLIQRSHGQRQDLSPSPNDQDNESSLHNDDISANQQQYEEYVEVI